MKDPRRSSITKGGIAVKIEDGTEEGIKFTIAWPTAAQACMRNNAKPIPRQTETNKISLAEYNKRQNAIWNNTVENDLL